MRFSTISKRLTAMLAALLLLTVTVQAESFSAIVTSKNMKVYADAEQAWHIGTLRQTQVVTVEDYSGGVAKISLGGNVGYASVSDMVALDSIATPAKLNTNSRVYQSANLNSRWLRVGKGMEVNLLATNGAWAMVERGGVVAYTNKNHLTTMEAVQPEAPEQVQPEQSAPAPEIVWETFPAKVTAARMPVYQQASTKSRCLGSLTAGVNVTVHAYCGEWAYIELNGRRGFAKIACMVRISETQEAPEQQQPEQNDYINNDKFTTEQIIYLFLTREMGLNTAVACGILANVEKECSFRVTAASYDGGYGIVQWTGVRNTRLKNWCKDNGYDHATLEGQLWYLKYELENHHPKTLKYLRTVENTPAGAYDAGHYFCYNFEIPASRAKRSVERGNLAKDKYWTRYANV